MTSHDILHIEIQLTIIQSFLKKKKLFVMNLNKTNTTYPGIEFSEPHHQNSGRPAQPDLNSSKSTEQLFCYVESFFLLLP